MSTPIHALSDLLRHLHPELQPGVWAYATVPLDRDPTPLKPLATFREREALTVIVKEDTARAADLPILFRCAWIALSVHSDLKAVGLTAAVAKALSERGISCNIVAAAYHDHVFVPHDRSEDALSALKALQSLAIEVERWAGGWG
jgi:uncharacterized protein